MSELYTTSILLDDVIDAVATFVQPFCLEAEIIRAQTNRTPLPIGQFVVLTELLSVELSKPRTDLAPSGLETVITSPTRIDVQLDFYGPYAGDQCRAVIGVLRTEYAAAMFPATIQPLYCLDGIQSPMISGENQWMSRWTTRLSLQIDPQVVVPAQSAVAINLSINP